MGNISNAGQTTYPLVQGYGYEGGRADSGPMKAQAALNTSAAVIPFGRVVTLDLANADGLAPNAAMPAKLIAIDDTDDNTEAIVDGLLLGVALHDMAHVGSDDGIKAQKMFSVLYEGSVNMIAETDVTPTDPVFVRVADAASPGAHDAIGRVRADANTDAAQVITITPTVANSKLYSLTVRYGGKSHVANFISSGAATAQEICDGLRASLAADPTFSGFTVGGTVTLTLTSTGVNSDRPVEANSNGPGVLGIVQTAPWSPNAVQVKGLRFRGSASAGEVVAVEILSVK